MKKIRYNLIASYHATNEHVFPYTSNIVCTIVVEICLGL